MPPIDQLDNIASEARALDVPAGAQPGPGGEPTAAPAASEPSADSVVMWSGIPSALGQAVVPVMPELATVYAPEQCRAWGVAMEKYAQAKGWNVGDKAPGVMLFFASAGFIFSTAIAFLKRLMASKRARAAAAQQQRPDTGTGAAAAASSTASVTGTGPNA